MTIDWTAVATIAAPIAALFVGVWVNRRFENRPVLISYFGHVSAFLHTPPGGQPIHVHTHSVVLRNAGRRSATNVRLHHTVLPDFNIWPTVVHHVDTLPNGSRDIVIPTLVPGEEITISYLYFPPVTVNQVNAGIKCDQGFAQPITVLLQRQYPRWLNRTTGILMIAGLVAIVYVVYLGVSAAIR
ncbi:MAG: hypothetical protein HZA69_07265 [Gammaproteobacteria bacterium]|nr:hypothetical protein [Gammaproteobacteria bacterium]